MKTEIITLHNQQLIGIAREIAYDQGQKECPLFWQEAKEDICAHGLGKLAMSICHANSFTYVIGRAYDGETVPEGLSLHLLPSGRWLKVWFEGGMQAFQQQFASFYHEWLPAHPEYQCAEGLNLEWYGGPDITLPDYPCGLLVPLMDKNIHGAQPPLRA